MDLGSNLKSEFLIKLTSKILSGLRQLVFLFTFYYKDVLELYFGALIIAGFLNQIGSYFEYSFVRGERSFKVFAFLQLLAAVFGSFYVGDEISIIVFFFVATENLYKYVSLIRRSNANNSVGVIILEVLPQIVLSIGVLFGMILNVSLTTVLLYTELIIFVILITYILRYNLLLIEGDSMVKFEPSILFILLLIYLIQLIDMNILKSVNMFTEYSLAILPIMFARGVFDFRLRVSSILEQGDRRFISDRIVVLVILLSVPSLYLLSDFVLEELWNIFNLNMKLSILLLPLILSLTVWDFIFRELLGEVKILVFAYMSLLLIKGVFYWLNITSISLVFITTVYLIVFQLIWKKIKLY